MIAIFLLMLLAPATAPATRPADPGFPIRARPGEALERLAAALDGLDLTPTQRKAADKAVEATRLAAKDVRKQQLTPEQARPKLMQLQEELMRKLTTILSRTQVLELREAMAGEAPRVRRRRARDEESPKPAEATNPPTTMPASVLSIGASAADCVATKVDGAKFSLASLRGRPVVLLFGSMSAPTFRDRVPMAEKLRRDYANKIHVLYVYTREAYPAGEWDVERNRDAKILLTQPATFDERLARAAEAITTLKLTGTVLVDDVKDTLALSLDAMPNGAIVLDRDGTIAFRQQWFDAGGLAEPLKAAIERPLSKAP